MSSNVLIGRESTPIDISNYTGVPLGILQSTMRDEVVGIYGQKLLEELGNIIEYYRIYDDGVAFISEGSNDDYLPADLKYAQTADLINKESRFMFGNPAETTFKLSNPDEESDETKQAISILQNLFDGVTDDNAYADKCLKGFKDACIGGRVAITLDFTPTGIHVRFLPAFSFVHEYDEYGRLKKLITFHTITDSQDKTKQRIFRKKWYMEDGICHIVTSTFDGMGQELESEPIVTRFKSLPCWVILNDGLTGDMDGESEVRRLANYEGWYSKLANADIDAGRQGMNPIRYAVDMATDSTKDLSSAAGAFWDLTSDTELKDGTSGTVGVLETAMSYSQPLSNTLSRLSNTMHNTLDVPDISLESMQGVITSGKAVKAVYWGLTMRCNEKMIAWEPALRFIANTIITGARLYPESAKAYIDGPVPTLDYKITIENPYSLPEDETEEKSSDMSEVNNQVRSRRSYIQKWQKINEKEADLELEQIMREKQMLEDNYTQTMWNSSQLTVPPQNSENGGDSGLEDEFETEELEDEDDGMDALFKELDDLEAGL